MNKVKPKEADDIYKRNEKQQQTNKHTYNPDATVFVLQSEPAHQPSSQRSSPAAGQTVTSLALMNLQTHTGRWNDGNKQEADENATRVGCQIPSTTRPRHII